MRLDRAIDKYLSWRQLERDAPPGSLETYYRILNRISSEWPNARLHEGRQGSEKLRYTIGRLCRAGGGPPVIEVTDGVRITCVEPAEGTGRAEEAA